VNILIAHHDHIDEISDNHLSEAAKWLEQKNMTLWTKELISPEIVSQDIASGLFCCPR
jgi:hypothetical protein